MQVELAGLVVILAVVGVLTDLRPGQRIAARPEAGPAPDCGLRGLFAGRRPGGGLDGLALTLRLVADELEKARRILERGETARMPIGAARLGQAAAGRDRSGGADDAAERERAQPARATVVVHATILRCG